MEKEIRISMRIDKELKQAFFALCEEKGQTPSKVIKLLMQDHIERNGLIPVVHKDGQLPTPPPHK